MIPYDITMRPSCAHKFVLRLMCRAIPYGHTNPFISLRAMAKFSKMLEHFQKWPLSKTSFGVCNCKNPSISVPREAIWHCDPELFQNSFHGCQNLEFPIELLWLYRRLQINTTSRVIKFLFSLCHFLKFYSLKFLIFNYDLIILIMLINIHILYMHLFVNLVASYSNIVSHKWLKNIVLISLTVSLIFKSINVVAI